MKVWSDKSVWKLLLDVVPVKIVQLLYISHITSFSIDATAVHIGGCRRPAHHSIVDSEN